jgi:hypothetical protein
VEDDERGPVDGDESTVVLDRPRNADGFSSALDEALSLVLSRGCLHAEV